MYQGVDVAAAFKVSARFAAADTAGTLTKQVMVRKMDRFALSFKSCPNG